MYKDLLRKYRAFVFSSPRHLNTLSSTKSYAELGTEYEHLVKKTLEPLGIWTLHVGGRGDCGIDLRGALTLPSISSMAEANSLNRIPLVVQCKRIGRPAAPVLIRELEGVLQGEPPGSVAFLACTQMPSDLCRQDIMHSNLPIGYFRICEDSGTISTIVLNDAIGRRIPGLYATVKKQKDRDYSPVLLYHLHVLYA